MNGYVIVPRSIVEEQVFANSEQFRVYIWCIIKATHKVRYLAVKVGKGYKTVSLCTGEFLYGRHSCSEELNIPGTTLEKHLKRLIEIGLISRHVTKHYSIIKIVRYSDMQKPEMYRNVKNEQPNVNKWSTKCQQKDTNYTHDPYR